MIQSPQVMKKYVPSFLITGFPAKFSLLSISFHHLEAEKNGLNLLIFSSIRRRTLFGYMRVNYKIIRDHIFTYIYILKIKPLFPLIADTPTSGRRDSGSQHVLIIMEYR